MKKLINRKITHPIMEMYLIATAQFQLPAATAGKGRKVAVPHVASSLWSASNWNGFNWSSIGVSGTLNYTAIRNLTYVKEIAMVHVENVDEYYVVDTSYNSKMGTTVTKMPNFEAALASMESMYQRLR